MVLESVQALFSLNEFTNFNRRMLINLMHKTERRTQTSNGCFICMFEFDATKFDSR